MYRDHDLRIIREKVITDGREKRTYLLQPQSNAESLTLFLMTEIPPE